MITAIYENKSSNEELVFPLNDDFFQPCLEVEGHKIPLTIKINAVSSGLALLMDSLTLEERIEYIETAILHLQSSDLDELLDQPDFMAAVKNGFATATWKETDHYCGQLNEIIAARTGNEFEFSRFEIDPPLDFLS
jgi:hypothetical protein